MRHLKSSSLSLYPQSVTYLLGKKKKKNVLVQAEIAEVSPLHQLDKEAKS